MSDGKKKFLYVNRRAPHGTIYALESIEVVLIGAAFEQDVSLAFIDDGVYQIAKGQNTKGIGTKNFATIFRALGDYDVRTMYVEQESLDERGLTRADLLEITHDTDDEEDLQSVHVVSRAEMAKIMSGQDVILSY